MNTTHRPQFQRTLLAHLGLAMALILTLTACQPEPPRGVPQPPASNLSPQRTMNTPFTATSDLAQLSAPGVLPRNIALKAFDPHRDAVAFTCRMQAERMPAPTPAAQALHDEAMQLTSPALWPNERNWPRAMQLWQQAADQGHWKAALMWLHTARTGAGENSEKGRFAVEPQPSETIVLGLERLMHLGLADAYFWMGELHQTGDGVKPSVDRAWAFWELAAELGSPLAQTRIAKALMIDYRVDEDPKKAAWANRPLKFKLLECAHAQGYGVASHELGSWLNLDAKHNELRQSHFKTPEEQYRYALQVLHDGVKFGSEDAAKYLSSSFRHGEPLVGSAFIDKAREDRYFELGEALYNNPDLRFPNLDRVLPLPPAKLPTWNMADVDGLIRAAQGVRVTPKKPQQPAANAPGRARVPEGHSLVMPADRSQWAEKPIVGFKDILSAPGVRTGLSMAAFDGYYQPLHIWATHPQSRPAGGIPPGEYESLRMRAMADMPPLHYRAGEPLDLRTADAWNMNHYFAQEGDHRLVYWFYKGTARAVQPLADHLARAGQVQAIAQASTTTCADGSTCPQSGIWQPEVTNTEHPLAQVFNGTLAGESWRRQAFVSSGQNLPQFAAQLAPMLAEGEAAQLQVKWRLMVACEAVCEAGFEKAEG